MQSYIAKPFVQVLLSLLLLCGILALGAYAHATLKQAKQGMMGPTTISVTGEGEVFAKPDVGQFTFSVRAEGADAATAQGASAEKVNAIMGYLKEQGIEERDIKTQGYNLSPKYRYDAQPCAMGMLCPPGEQVLDGYEVFQSVSVKVRDLAKAGALISGAGERGATDLSGLTFTIDDESELEAEARELAIADAKARAQKIATDLNVRLVKMINYYEHENMAPPYYGGGMMEAVPMMKADMAAPELPVGENTIMSKVTIVYEIR
jgi:uncharacterized protein YggE